MLLSRFQHGTIQPIKHILQEDTRIIQLRFHPLLENKVALISSLKRVLVVEIDTSTVTQVGQKERKNPNATPFGADFSFSGNETVILSSRPGLRLWLSNCEGTVKQTLIYKDSIASQPRSKLILLSFQEEFGGSKESTLFGPVHCLNNGLVFTYSTKSMFILDKDQCQVFSSNRFNNPKVVLRQATVFHNEIFLMLENRLVIRVSDRPDRSATVSATVDRPFLSITKSIRPTLQSTITKLAHKISMSDVSDMKAVQSSPHIMESLTSALAPLFETNKSVPVCRAAPPKALLVMPENRSPSPSPYIQDTPNPSSPPSPPMSPSPLNNEDDLLYGSYHQGRKRKLKLNTKSNTIESEQPDIVESDQVPVTESWSRPVSVTTDEHELKQELERKDQLLATLLQLDQPTKPDVPAENDDHQSDDSSNQQEEIAEIDPGSISNTSTEEGVDDDDDDLSDNIYSKYASSSTTDDVDDNSPHHFDNRLPDSSIITTRLANKIDLMSIEEDSIDCSPVDNNHFFVFQFCCAF